MYMRVDREGLERIVVSESCVSGVESEPGRWRRARWAGFQVSECWRLLLQLSRPTTG